MVGRPARQAGLSLSFAATPRTYNFMSGSWVSATVSSVVLRLLALNGASDRLPGLEAPAQAEPA
jgi:hypothetical protein